MINVPFNSIERAALESLVTNEVREGRTLDYKEKLPPNGRDDRKEFLADVTAFANAAGWSSTVRSGMSPRARGYRRSKVLS